MDDLNGGPQGADGLAHPFAGWMSESAWDEVFAPSTPETEAAADRFIDRLMADVYGSEPGGSSEELSMDGPMGSKSTVDPDHLLGLWAQIDRCALIAAEALAADVARTSDITPNVGALKETFATELWVTLQDMVGFARLGEFEEWSGGENG